MEPGRGASRNKRKPAAELPEGGEGGDAGAGGQLPAVPGKGAAGGTLPATPAAATMTSAILRRNSSKQGLQNLIR